MGRPRARFCLWGHDTEISGRDSHGGCRECRRGGRRRAAGLQRGVGIYCARGHDKRKAGTFANGYCKVCDLITRGKSPCPSNRIKAYLGYDREQAALAWATYRGVKHSAAYAAANRLWTCSTLSIDMADRWCIAVGAHLALLYPEVYELEKAAV